MDLTRLCFRHFRIELLGGQHHQIFDKQQMDADGIHLGGGHVPVGALVGAKRIEQDAQLLLHETQSLGAVAEMRMDVAVRGEKGDGRQRTGRGGGWICSCHSRDDLQNEKKGGQPVRPWKN